MKVNAMKIRQLSVFLENKPGRLTLACKALAGAGINILTLTLADTQQFGILRLIVREWEEAKAALEQAGCVVRVSEVVAVEVADHPGGLNAILQICEQANVNIEYMYAFTMRRDEKAVLIFCFEDSDEAVRVLQQKNISLVESVALYDAQ